MKRIVGKVALCLILAGIGIWLLMLNITSTNKVTFTELTTHIQNDNIEQIAVLQSGVDIVAKLKSGDVIKTNNPNTEESNNIIYKAHVPIEQSVIYPPKKVGFLDILFFCIIGWSLFSILRSFKGGEHVKSMFEDGIDTTDKDSFLKFEDVAGAEDSIIAMRELVDYLKDPTIYRKYGSHAPKGVIMHGPPGTGKTLLAKALAGEANCSFIEVTGSNFVDKFVGNGAARVRHLFTEAKKKAPCIIFIDEIDAIGGERSTYGGSEERHQTLNELLSAMNGFSDEEGIIIIGATNRIDSLDNALLRSGRFDTKIYVGLPNVSGREKIFEVYSRNRPLDSDIDLKYFAKLTTYFSGADIENVMNKAGFYAARKKAPVISTDDILKAINHLIAGEEKLDRTGISDNDKKLTSYHEAGHAIVAKSMCGIPVTKISIIPTTHGAGGYTLVDVDEKAYRTKKDLLNQIAIYLGGRAAEEIVYGVDGVTTGASNDIERATKLAEDLIKVYGMHDRFGMISLANKTTLEKEVLEEASLIIRTKYEEVLMYLTNNRDKLENLYNRLIEKEILLESELTDM